jgi:hypothetical protein
MASSPICPKAKQSLTYFLTAPRSRFRRRQLVASLLWLARAVQIGLGGFDQDLIYLRGRELGHCSEHQKARSEGGARLKNSDSIDLNQSDRANRIATFWCKLPT